MIRIAIADDQILLREMLVLLLSAEVGIEVVGSASDSEEIVRLCRETKPDIVLLDIKMQGDGIHALEKIKKEMPKIKAIMLTVFDDVKSVMESFGNGADGYILKDIKTQQLVMAVKCVNDGLFVMQDGVAKLVREHIKHNLLRHVDRVEDHYDEYGLDTIDRKLISLIIDGKSNKEIAEFLNFSEGTIKNKITRILAVTGLKDRTQLAVFALQHDII